MQTKFALKDCPLTFINDDLISAGLNPDYNSPLFAEFSFKIIQAVIRSQRRGYIGAILDDTHGALAKVFAAADAGEVTDPEQLAVVNWLRVDGGDVIESYRADNCCKQRDVYRAAIKLAQLALAGQVNFDAGKDYDDVEYAQYYIQCLDKDDSVDVILDSLCLLAERVCTYDVKFNAPAVHGHECIEFILESMPYNLQLEQMYMDRINDLGFTDLDEIMKELRQYY